MVAHQQVQIPVSDPLSWIGPDRAPRIRL